MNSDWIEILDTPLQTEAAVQFVTSPTAGWAAGACSATRVSLRAGCWLASAWAASVGYISMKVCTTRGSSALPLSCRSRPIAASKLIALWYGRSDMSASK